MSDHEPTSPAPTLPNWILSAAGVVGSIVIIMAVLAVAYWSSRPAQTVDQEIVAERTANLSDVQAKQADLYNNYSWVDQKKGIIRIPVKDAMGLIAAQLDQATRDKPAAPARMTLAASPAGFTPPAPPAPAAPAAASAPAANSSTPAPASAPAAASAP
jgi:pyridoxine/pyridoxamine 5'-phosphate oxidase